MEIIKELLANQYTPWIVVGVAIFILNMKGGGKNLMSKAWSMIQKILQKPKSAGGIDDWLVAYLTLREECEQCGNVEIMKLIDQLLPLLLNHSSNHPKEPEVIPDAK